MVGEFNVMWDISNDSNLLSDGNPKVKIRKLIMRMLMKNTISGLQYNCWCSILGDLQELVDWIFRWKFLGIFFHVKP